MIDRKLFQKTFSTLHASPDTLSEVYRTVHEEEHKQSLHRRHAISKGVLIAAVLAMCITVAGAGRRQHRRSYQGQCNALGQHHRRRPARLQRRQHGQRDSRRTG